MITVVKDTIAAISTPTGLGGIGIVRLSGPESSTIIQKIFRKATPKNIAGFTSCKDIAPRHLYYGHVVDPAEKAVVDEVLMVFMPAPKSYTGEDVVEIQAHGGTIALRGILDLVIKIGARLAAPGEFTRRAYLNGRIDLSQAEATIEIIKAKTDASLRSANRNLAGGIGEITRGIRKKLFEILAMFEALIDFPEDVEEALNEKAICEKIDGEILGPIKKMVEGYRYGHLLREGARVVIMGRTNVGKSSLLNGLIQRERAIVTAYPGTTRDSIEESINIFGLPAVVVDTAGWRKTSDPVEKIGIGRSQELSESADLILFMVDGSTGIVPEDEILYSQIQKKEKILIINKKDLMNDGFSVDMPKNWHFSEILYLSAKFGNGVKTLKKKIYEKLIGSGKVTETEVLPNLRQKNLFQESQQAINNALKGMREKAYPELIAIDIQEAIDGLDEITGETVKPDILEEIFSRFCIGK